MRGGFIHSGEWRGNEGLRRSRKSVGLLRVGEFLPFEDVLNHVPLFSRHFLQLVKFASHEVVLAAVELYHLCKHHYH